MTFTKLLTVAAVTALLLANGCSTTDSLYRKTASVVDPDSARLQSGLKWLTPPSSMGLRPASLNDMTVFLRVKNSSGSDLPEMYSQISESLQNAGYKVTRNIDEAKYYVVADTRFYGENRKKDAGGALLTGAAIGGVTGAVVGHNVGGGRSGLGAAAGAVVGAAAANVMANRNKMVEIDLVVDLRIGERSAKAVETVRTTDTSATTAHAESALRESGRDKATTTERQRVETEDEFLFHSNRIVAHATKRGLTPEEALPHLQQKLVAAISSVLP